MSKREFIKDKPDEFYEGLDKRTWEYKSYIEWKKLAIEEIEVADPEDVEPETKEVVIKVKESIGLGDFVDKITKATGIKKVVEWLAGEDCGCEERKQKMNKVFHLRDRKVRCLKEHEYRILSEYFGDGLRPRKMTTQMKPILIPIYNRVFRMRYRLDTTCESCKQTMLNGLHQIFKYYMEDYGKKTS